MKDDIYLLRRIRDHYIKPYYRMIFLAVVCMIIVAIANALHVALIKPILDHVFLRHDQRMLLILPVIVILIAIFKAFSSYYQNYLIRYVGQRIVSDIQIELYKHMIHSDLEVINKDSSGKIISRFTNDISIMRSAISNIITGLIRDLLTVILLIIWMFYQDVKLSIFVFIVFPLTIVPIINLGRRMRKISNSTQEELGEYTAKLDDSFRAIKLIKSFNSEETQITKANNMVENIFKLYNNAIRLDSISSPIIEMLSGIAIAGVIWYGGHQVLLNKTTAGSFFSFITAFIMAYKPMKSLSLIYNSVQEGLAASKRIFTILNTKPEIKDEDESLELDIQDYSIKFENVFFFYDKVDKWTLNDLNLEIPQGKTISLVGPSGAGKSTIISTLMRFYDIDKGIISIGGNDIKKIKLKSLRDSITFVSQDVVLFDETILSNIAYGNPNASKEQIIEAAKKAYAHDFIMNLKNNYDANIGQNGNNLSGGQKQRISIARAFLKNSPILILDEATSSLDSISEEYIQNSLAELKKNKTTIIIAHRLSNIINSDLIYVIADGKVVECGTHHQLLKNKSQYCDLYNNTNY